MSVVEVGLYILFLSFFQVVTFIVVGMTEFTRARWKPHTYMLVVSVVACVGHIVYGWIGAVTLVLPTLVLWKYWLYPIYKPTEQDHFEQYVHRHDK